MLTGIANFTTLPSELKKLNLYLQQIRGDVDIRTLPASLGVICVQSCQVTGTLDLGSLPRSMIECIFIENFITGIVHVENLPQGLRWIHIGERHIEDKVIHIGALPPGDFELNFKELPSAVDYVFAEAEDRYRLITAES